MTRRFRTHHFDKVTSTIDAAFDLISSGRLFSWDSVLARDQTAARGQMRRSWTCIQGNVFAAIRLPVIPPFDGSEAAVATGALLCAALSGLGCPTRLKWPNDIVIVVDAAPRKVVGILIEEKHESLVAGVGINLLSAPDPEKMDREEALPPAALSTVWPENIPLPSYIDLWRELMQELLRIYASCADFGRQWQSLACDQLVWLGQDVQIHEGNKTVRGNFSGLASNGGAILETRSGPRTFTGGTMRPVQATPD